MPIFLNTNKNILFIHPPKTGGEFISEYLSNFGFRSLHSKKGEVGNYIPSQHLHSEEMIKSIEKLGIKNFGITIMTVRNPYSRLESQYFYNFRKIFSVREINFGFFKRLLNFKTFNNYIKEAIDQTKKNRSYMNNHFRPQNEFEVFNPKIFKLENGFEVLFKYVENELDSKKLGKYPDRIPRPYFSKFYRVKWGKDTIELVNEFYKEDFKKYNYKLK